jgi:hypothetical protein
MHHSWAGGTSRQGREVSLAMLFFPLSLEHPVPGFQQPNEGGIWPVLLMCSACSAVLAVARFLFSSREHASCLRYASPMEPGNQLVFRTGTHPLDLNLQEHKSRAMIKVIDTTKNAVSTNTVTKISELCTL